MNLTNMAAEVEQVNKEHGWYDDERTFCELIALLHSEVSEALEAYRQWGLDDATVNAQLDMPLQKPEGVGSEFADILIRLLDMSKRFGVDLREEVANHPGRFGINVQFGDSACYMHMHISHLAFAAEDTPWEAEPIGPYYAAIFVYLVQWSVFCGIDLEAEYARKLAYNKTRPYRHGGKKL
jgi:hypothetical protein